MVIVEPSTTVTVVKSAEIALAEPLSLPYRLRPTRIAKAVRD